MTFIKLFEEIKLGKYNLIIFAICFIILFHIFNHISSCNKSIENMADASDAQIAEVVKKIYLSDEFIRSISAASAQVQKDGLKITGDLIVTGNIKATGEISNSKYSMTALNTKIDSILK